MNKWEVKHNNNLASYGRAIDKIYAVASDEAAAIGANITGFDKNKPFAFKDYPQTKNRVDKLVNTLSANVNKVIVNGITAEWADSNYKNDELAQRILGKVYKGQDYSGFSKYFNHNTKACDAFQNRVSNGMNLSDRVWKLSSQFKTELEMNLDLGLRAGKSASEMSRDIRSHLKEPNKLFRRVADEHGMLHLSTNAKVYKPGQGVYRSSYKNAMRLTITETNMAYRNADHERWQQLDFVVGFEVRTSVNNHPVFDICDHLTGKYPKSFVFNGWHPHCRCFATAIQQTDEEFIADTKRIMQGEQPSGDSVNMVSNTPKGFNDWIADNKERIITAKSKPYFIKDNFSGGDITKGLRFETKVAEMGKNIVKNKSNIDNVISKLENAKVEYNEVKYLNKELEERDIIERISGGDMTKGSCSSLAFAYAGNKGGLDVLDFRDGMSRKILAMQNNIMEIAEKVGGVVAKNINDFKKATELLSTVVDGKEYYFTCGSHAAIIRKTSGVYEYLELQSRDINGFKTLTKETLKQRFGAKQSRSFGGRKYETQDCIIDIELLRKEEGFRKLLGYINTASGSQKKGITGSIK